MSTALRTALASLLVAPAAWSHSIDAPIEVEANPDGTFQFEFTYTAPPADIEFEFGAICWGELSGLDATGGCGDGFCMSGAGGWTFTETIAGQLDDPTQPGQTFIDASICSPGYEFLMHTTTVLPSTVSVPDATTITVVRARPNPMRSHVAFEFDSDLSGRTLTVFDAAGRVVHTLELGSGSASWDGRLGNDRRVPAGVYFYRVAGVESKARRLVVVD